MADNGKKAAAHALAVGAAAFLEALVRLACERFGEWLGRRKEAGRKKA